MAHNRSIITSAAILIALGCCLGCNAFTFPSSSQPSKNAIAHQSCPASSSPLFMASDTETETEKKAAKKEGYVPKWKKSATLADTIGDMSAEEKGLVGAIPISFQMGKGKKATFLETSGMPGQPLKLVASQAGQYIQYGCGKGECGTCESKCNGKYVRPCVDVVPTDLEPNEATGEYETLVIQVKGTRAKVVSSGKFFSAKSFLLGFWNNFLGMFGLVRDRRKAKKNWEDRISNEDAIKALTAEKKRKRAAEAAAKENSQ